LKAASKTLHKVVVVDSEPIESAKEKKPKRALSLRARALSYLSRREYSRTELRSKLLTYASPDDVDGVLDDFEQRSWLNAERFAEQFVNARLSRFGTWRIRHDLLQHQLDPELNAKVLAIAQDSELERAYLLWKRRFVELPEGSQDRRQAYVRQFRFLAQRGFSSAVIQKILRSASDDIYPTDSM
jgi:regulatory protein